MTAGSHPALGIFGGTFDPIHRGHMAMASSAVQGYGLDRLLLVPASTLSHHIAALVKADLLLQDRRGRKVICMANYTAMNGLVAYMTEPCCTGVEVSKDGAANSAAAVSVLSSHSNQPKKPLPSL